MESIILGLYCLVCVAAPVPASYLISRNLRSRVGLSRIETFLCGVLIYISSIIFLQTVLGYLGFFGSWWSVCVPLLLVPLLLQIGLKKRPLSTGFDNGNYGIGLKSALSVTVICMIILAGCSLMTHPLNSDTLAYRLPRIAYWLQEGSIRHFDSIDPRHDYLGVNWELLYSWLLIPFETGFPLTGSLQGFSAILMVLATFAWAKNLGLSLPAATASALFLLLTPIFVAQATTSQSDLFTAAMATMGLLFFQLSVKRSQALLAIPAWLGLALALGTKGTLFYWVPGLLLMGLSWILVAKKKPGLRLILTHTAIGVLAISCLAAPRFVENSLVYGNPFAPPAEMERIHTESAFLPNLEKSYLNNLTYAIHLLPPISNPLLPAKLSVSLTQKMLPHLPSAEEDRHYLSSRTRQKSITSLLRMGSSKPYSDVGSFGLITVSGAFVGLVVALASLFQQAQRKTAIGILGLGASVICFAIFYNGLSGWTPFQFRYWLLVLAPTAICGGYIFQRIAEPIKNYGLSVLGLLALLSFGIVFTRGFNSGLENILIPEKVSSWHHTQAQRNAVEWVADKCDEIEVDLPYESYFAGFFRNATQPRIRFARIHDVALESAQAKILPAKNFPVVDRIDARVWSAPQDAKRSFVIYRQPEPNSSGYGFLTNLEVVETKDPHRFLVTATARNLIEPKTTIQVSNLAGSPLNVQVENSRSRTGLSVGGHASAELEIQGVPHVGDFTKFLFAIERANDEVNNYAVPSFDIRFPHLNSLLTSRSE